MYFLSLELLVLHQGGNNQSKAVVMPLSLSAVAPCLAAASALRQTQRFRQNCRYSCDMDPSATPHTNSDVFLLVALGPCVNVSVPSCSVGNQHGEVELGDMSETLTLQTFLGCRTRQPFLCLSGQCLLIKIQDWKPQRFCVEMYFAD